ncbi:MAG: type IV toxin-antitoxin system AbiEi family antitoxin domain-containing protein [Elusimicrobiota bacterium]
MGSYKAVYNRLYEIAADQDGYFTTKQAIAAGYADNTHSFHVKAGNWKREHRGIYRLAKYPLSPHFDKVLWYLWSRDRNDVPQGTYSHETALSFYELSDINPAKLHMTVPPGFRRSTPIPAILVLHRGLIHKEDMTLAQGFRITTPLKAISDLLVTRTVQMDHMAQAVKQAFQRGLIAQTAFAQAPRISAAVKKEIEDLRVERHG